MQPNMREFTELLAGGSAAAACAGGWQRAQWCTSQLMGKTLVHGPRPRELALTFDDGPNDRYTQEVLEKLDASGVKATFFVVGMYAKQLPWLVRRVVEAGHEIGNHTFNHRNLAWLPAGRIRDEIWQCSALLQDILGKRVRWFRPPYGKRRPAVLHIAEEFGLETVMWNSMGFDWRPGRTPKQIMKGIERRIRANRKAGRGSTILLHDGGPGTIAAERRRTVQALGSLLERGPAANYRFVTVGEWWG